MSYISNIQIAEKTLNEIKTIIGYPTIDTEFDYLLNEDQIKEYVIAPSLETYFTYFPLIEERTYNVTGSNAVEEFDSNEKTLGIIRHQFIPQSSTVSGASLMQQGMFYGNPFYTASQVISRGAYGLGGNFGTPFGYQHDLFVYQNRFYNESLEGSNTAHYLYYDEMLNKIKIKSSIPGSFYIRIAIWSNEVENSIPIRLRQSFIEYCQGKLLEKLSSLLKLSETELPVTLDSDYMEEKSTRLLEKSLEYWKEASMVQVIR